jgi:two-component system, NtrC family, nitrogen regulation sensor histidine kinase NtrY
MAFGRRLKRAFFALLIAFGILLWLAALLLFSQVAENSDDFARFPLWIVLINSAGVAVLLALLIANVVRLIRDHRRHVPGSRLKARMVGLLVVLAITPLAVLYIFSVQFINRGIDDWFSVDVEEGLGNALELSQTALDIQIRDRLSQLQTIATSLVGTTDAGVVSRLGEVQRSSGAYELTLFAPNNQIVATSADVSAAPVPAFLNDEIAIQLRQGTPYVGLDLRADGQYQVVAAIVTDGLRSRGDAVMLRGIFPIDQRINELANAVNASYGQFGELAYISTALKVSFTLTLSLVLLVSMLASIYGAFFSAERLIVPIQQLMQGTRAVARGDFDTVLPTPARDEIGFLINSFNDMTQRLAGARREASLSQQQVESERYKLAVILERLSTGVVSLEADMSIRTANEAAGAILGVDLESHVGESIVELSKGRPLLEQFLAVSSARLERGETEWREQISLRGEVGRRVLMCACTELPTEGDTPRAYVVVFDDITALLQAQRDAAWGEVARRLAHEIKNPLTPIQLSAERMRRRYLVAGSGDLDLLDRATHTIIQQVEAMKEMVNAFSQYARAPDIELSRVDLNALIGEVTELYRHQEHAVAIELACDPDLPEVDVDIGRVRQVLHNLIRNALEAMENQHDARIEIESRRASSDQVEILVADNGPGFSREIIDQVFEPYVTSKAKGTGLGLAIVKKLVEEHGGQIRAGNGRRGGAEISILLPISGVPAAMQPGPRRENRRERA